MEATADTVIAGKRVLELPIPKIEGRRILVTGACGSIGGQVVKRAKELGAVVFGLDSDENAVAQIDEPWLLLGRAKDWDKLLPARVEFLIHCAAYKHVILGQRPTSAFAFDANNEIETALLCDAASKAGVKVIFCSTDKAAGTSHMGHTKLMAERIVAKIGGVSVRLVNVVRSRGNFLDKWRAAANGRKDGCEIWTGCKIPVVSGAVRYFIQPEDAAEALLYATGFKAGTYILDHVPRLTMGEVFKAWALPGMEVEEIPLRAGEVLEEKLINERWERTETCGEPHFMKVVERGQA